MAKYLFMVPNEDEEFTLLTVDGQILVTDDPAPGSPRIRFSDKTTIPSVDVKDVIVNSEHRD